MILNWQECLVGQLSLIIDKNFVKRLKETLEVRIRHLEEPHT